MFVSVTRLRLRRWLFLPAFAVHAVRSNRQVGSSPGFVGGSLAYERSLGFWTVTVWADERAMKAFRNGGAHLKAMPRLSRWCDEASYVHWEQDDAAVPTAAVAFARLGESGRLSKIRHPSAAHGGGERVEKSPPKSAGPLLPRPGRSDISR